MKIIKENTSAASDEAKRVFNEQQQKLADLMKARTTQSFKLRGIGHFIHQRQCFPKIESQSTFYELLETLGLDDIIKRTIHNASLRSCVNGNEKKGEPSLREVILQLKDECGIDFEDVDDFISTMLDVDFVKDKIQIREA